MTNHLLSIKAALAAVFAALASFLGWRGILAVCWVGAMALDYLSGTLAACKNGQWASARAREGLWHKGGCILVVTICAIADGVLGLTFSEMGLPFTWPNAILPFVLALYILTEIGSNLENAQAMGAPVPSWLTRLFAKGKAVVNAAGSAAAGMEAENE